VNSKIKFLIQKNLSSSLSARLPLPTHSAFGPAGPASPSPPGGQSPAHMASQPLGPRVSLAYFAEDVFFFDSRLPFSAPSLYSLADILSPLVNSIYSTASADPDRVTTAPPLPRPPDPHLGMPPNLYRPHHSPLNLPSNQALTSLNGLNHHSPPPLLRPLLQRPPAPIKAPEDPRNISPLTELLPSPLPR
jgi:hypothetical protein